MEGHGARLLQNAVNALLCVLLAGAVAVVPTAHASTSAAGHGQAADALNKKKKKKKKHNEIALTHPGSHDSGHGASTIIGGGFGSLAPWPAGRTMTVGKPCGNYFGQGAHTDYGGRWQDDRYAVDIGVCGASDFGTPILAAAGGVVRVANADPNYGKSVIVETRPHGLAFRYSHLDTLSVRVGQSVRAGDQLGTLGHSGAGGGSKANSHLHFAVYRGPGSHQGVIPPPFAGVKLCDGCSVASLTTPPVPRTPEFRAALTNAFPGDATDRVYVTAGTSLDFGFDLQFNRFFDSNDFVLLAATPDLITRFTGMAGNFNGVVSSTNPFVGTYRGKVTVPADTPPGEYPLKWLARNATTGQLGNAQAQIILVVSPPPPPDHTDPGTGTAGTGTGGDGGSTTPAPSGPQVGQEFISDESTSGFTRFGGPWTSYGGGGAYGGTYWYLNNYLPCKGDTQEGGGTWYQTLQNGVYDVYAYIPSNVPANAAPLSIPYTVHYREGTTAVVMDQHYNAGTWSFIAHLGFNGYSSVELGARDNQNGTCFRKYIPFDAVKWVYRGP